MACSNGLTTDSFPSSGEQHPHGSFGFSLYPEQFVQATPALRVPVVMIKRVTFLLLLALVAMLSFVHADDSLAAPVDEKAPTEQVPPGVTILGDKEPVPSNKEQVEQFIGGGGGFIPTGGITYRWRYTFPWAGGFRYGWRYPLGYWNTFGRSIYGSNCLFGRPYGGFFYC